MTSNTKTAITSHQQYHLAGLTEREVDPEPLVGLQVLVRKGAPLGPCGAAGGDVRVNSWADGDAVGALDADQEVHPGPLRVLQQLRLAQGGRAGRQPMKVIICGVRWQDLRPSSPRLSPPPNSLTTKQPSRKATPWPRATSTPIRPTHLNGKLPSNPATGRSILAAPPTRCPSRSPTFSPADPVRATPHQQQQQQPLSELFRKFEPSSSPEATDTLISKTNTIRTKYHSHMHAIKSHQLHSATIVVRHPRHPCLESAQSCSTKAGSPRSLSSHVSSLPHEVLMSLAESRGVHASFLPESGSQLAVLAGYFLLAKPSLSLSRLANFKVLHEIIVWRAIFGHGGHWHE
ncbi:hypothetical protein PtB15_1B436 [Puccinia triticina]|nr:hypothetical protein PtB15_1B436 [Puccinia triticina]